MSANIELIVNGTRHSVGAEPDTSLLEVLRDDLGITGPKYGCGESMCGACTVHVDGVPVHSCVTACDEVKGAKITTIEGLADGERLHPLQQAFLDEGAMQCAYCVSGMIMTAVPLMKSKAEPTDEEIVAHMNGNVCRCGGYPRMVAAIKRAYRTQERR